ncbi:MAG: phospholipase D-like domain-containing protein [Candidatus Acidiferrum sp.]
MMTDSASKSPVQATVVPLRLLADQAFSRAAGAPLVPGNQIRLLKGAAENYPAWIEAIQSAKRTIHFESYIIHDDEIGREFAKLLGAKAREGVRVRLVYDWFGARGAASWLFWRRLRKSGVEVRCFNPPKLASPLDWLSRDHRKMITVDGQVAFVTGLCVGKRWVGEPKRGIEPWRDTGVAIVGPAVFDIEQAFVRMWALMGSPVPAEDVLSESPSDIFPGDTALRVVASEPTMAGLYRLDMLVAAIARNSMWLTDAYFLGTPSYVQSLCAAALDGVDVRLLVPRTSDIPVVRTFSRVGYRTLLEAGVRIFEWNGSMLHAKTGVADGRWARVGSTNLNLSSWMGNYELDVVAEDEKFAKQMEEMYIEDLAHSTEIILSANHKVQPREKRDHSIRHRSSARGSAGRAATGVLTIGSTVGAAITKHRLLGPAEASIMLIAALALALVAVLACLWPVAFGIVIAAVSAWGALALITQALRLRFSRKE